MNEKGFTIKKEITIDQLAEMVMREFAFMRADMDKRFEQVDIRFARLEGVMATKDDLARAVAYLEKKIDRIETVVLSDHSLRISRLERLKTA